MPWGPPQIKGWGNQYPAALGMDWVRVSACISNTKQSVEAAEACASLVARCVVETTEDLRRRLQRVGANALRMARARVDCVAMLLHRLFYQAAVQDIPGLDLHPFCDASPNGVALSYTPAALTATSKEY